MALKTSLLVNLLMFLVLTSVVSAIIKPRLSVIPRTRSKTSITTTTTSKKDDRKTFYYTQTLDHFNYRPDSFTTFQQKYIINSRYWGGANTSSPIFVYLGAEAPIEEDVDSILDDYAPIFNALLVYIEHRYYGESVPFGSWKEAYSNTTTLGYFNSAQALADYAELIVNLKHNLTAETSPVVVVGGSYGGMLASWFRLKYPHIAMGALASSAPILNIDDIIPEDYYPIIVSKDFEEVSKTCYDTIQQSWSIIDSHEKNGLPFLTQKFKTCNPLNSSSELKDFLEGKYCEAAQYDYDLPPLANPVNRICDAIDELPKGTDVLTRIAAGVVAYIGEQSCYDIDTYNNSTDQSSLGCKDTYGVSFTPRPHWTATEFGGHNIKLVLQKFGSNIIFSNGLKDPYSGGGILENLSDSLVALTTTNGSHCLDIQPAIWLVGQQASEVKIMKGWITDYNTMLRKENSGQGGVVASSHIWLTVIVMSLSFAKPMQVLQILLF
ncbi:Lysosomal pro-x carboxypeptidase [Thalictrum thalictroides]|uniref:Lysosomal pro-x carboxypeptidase n=1 Tax=Thalictrum thalictroides TaxID=46969 RepID=A0A7J6WQX2_THATH|nr:Lysosomal pro-x carboxypeptidase [Thalictrum thalictroides]